jgi:hypothetical protein
MEILVIIHFKSVTDSSASQHKIHSPAILLAYEAQPLTLREEQKLQVFEKSVKKNTKSKRD